MKLKHLRTMQSVCCALLGSVFCAVAADTLVPAGSVWKYLDTGVSQGTVWREPAFDDTTWPSGLAQLGFGDGDEATVLNRFPNGTPLITAYFRKAFDVIDPAFYANLTVRLLRDDGGVVYINGVEVFRSSMPPLTNITYSTLASLPSDGSNEVNFVTRTVPASVLVPGENLIAVEIHQVNAASSDLSFDLQLFGNISGQNSPPVANPQNIFMNQNTARSIQLTGSDLDGNPLTYSIVSGPTHGTLNGTPPSVVYIPGSNYIGSDSFTFKVNDGQVDSAPATVSITVNPPPGSLLVVPTNSVWRYLDTGSDPDPQWKTLAYNDTAWASGLAPLGFGDGDEATVINPAPNGQPLIASYYRRPFFVSNAVQVASLTLRLWRDDGGVVYINGVEVFRNNMPAGPISYSTFASATAGDDGSSPVAVTIPASMLVNGVNVISAEIHQVNSASSDMSFMLELRSNRGNSTNRPPTALSQSIVANEDSSAPITLQASDPDNNLLSYTYTQPSHGTLTGVLPNLLYQPSADYHGSDSFSFTVNDGRGGSATATINITVNPVNDAPIAVAKAASPDAPTELVRNLVLVAANNLDALAILDGSASSDIDGDGLQYAWFANDSTTPFSTDPSLTATLPLGNYTMTLVVSDGQATSSDSITVQVFTPCEVVQNLTAQVQAAPLLPNERNALLGHLNAACATFNAGNPEAGIQQLELFQTRVTNKIQPDNPQLAQTLIQAAQDIINIAQ